MIATPDTGKRQSRLNPPSEWKTKTVPDLRIVDDALWGRVKARQDDVRQAMNPAGILTDRPRPERARRPTYLLSGLLRCACCGASYTLINKTAMAAPPPATREARSAAIARPSIAKWSKIVSCPG